MTDISANFHDALDAALEMTFPASDPIAVFVRDYARDGATPHDERMALTSIGRDERSQLLGRS